MKLAGVGTGRDRRRAFRGITAPASLKLLGDKQALPGNPAFRGITAPASLKRGGRLSHLSEVLSTFRGITAPASLKPSIVGAAAASAAIFPGHYCPGLIEAQPYCRRLMPTPNFPGHYCPGLIEACTLPTGPGRRYFFPGHYCPGLIEAALWRGLLCALPTPFRGITAPASLKRTQRVVDPTHHPPLSGALLPRPH